MAKKPPFPPKKGGKEMPPAKGGKMPFPPKKK